MARIVSNVVESLLDHNNLADLTVGDDHTQYALLAGRGTPQQFNFGTASGAATGYLSSTAHATKGKYFLNAAGTIVIDDANTRIGIGTNNPQTEFVVASIGSGNTRGVEIDTNVSVGEHRIYGFDRTGGAYDTLHIGGLALHLAVSGVSKWFVNDGGNFLGTTDNQNDIGTASATRPRTGYFGTSLVAPLISATSLLRIKGYTVATLPAGTQGDKAFVTDALGPTYLATVVGGGAVVTEVFYNGTNWVCT